MYSLFYGYIGNGFPRDQNLHFLGDQNSNIIWVIFVAEQNLMHIWNQKNDFY